MNCVATRGEFLAKLRPNDAAAAVRGIDRDSDVHCALKVASTKHKFNSQKSEAGDPRYRLPLSQLDSPSERGASEERSIFLLLKISNDSCNANAAFV